MIIFAMVVFCILWIPFIYLFYRSLKNGSRQYVSFLLFAFLGNTAFSLLRFLSGDFVSPDAYGALRWLHYFLDIITIPVIIPLLIALVFLIIKKSSNMLYLGEFTLVWLIPESFFSAIRWSPVPDPVLLMLVPVIWSALAIGIPFLVYLFHEEIGFVSVASLCAAIVLVPLSVTVLWVFYARNYAAGLPLLVLLLFPAVFYIVRSLHDYIRSELYAN